MTRAEIERLNDLLDDNECRLSHDGGHGHHEIEENAYREMWALAKQAVDALREAKERQ
jgi:hypothetical protein